MPYIDEVRRDDFIPSQPAPFNVPGELNYVITEVIVQYIDDNGLSYNEAINAIVGALECCKLEFYRRVAAPYEDKAIKRNGDVYPPELVLTDEEEG